MKNIRIFIRKFSFFGGKIFSVYLNRRVFVMKVESLNVNFPIIKNKRRNQLKIVFVCFTKKKKKKKKKKRYDISFKVSPCVYIYTYINQFTPRGLCLVFGQVHFQ